MSLELVGGIAIGVAVVEYYRRVLDGIRKEQIADLRGRQAAEDVEPFDRLERPKRRDMVSKEQHKQLQQTGRTGGHYKGGAPA